VPGTNCRVGLVGDGGTLRFDDRGGLRAATGLRGTVMFSEGDLQRLQLDLSAMTERSDPTGVACVSRDGCAE
jgi:hypothetical protein